MEEGKLNTPSGNWPVKHNLKLASILSLIITALAAWAAITALLDPAQHYPSDLVQSLIPTDIATVAIFLPVLLASLWLVQRRKLIGLLCWPGALFSVLYIFIPYLIVLPFNVLSLAYILIVPLSASVMIGLVASLDGDLVRRRLQDFVPARTSGGILIGLGVMIIVRQAALMVAALSSNTPVAMMDMSVWIADFTVGSPAMLATGVLLWRRKPFGYTTGGGLLLAYGALSIGLTPYMLLQPTYTGAPLDVAGFVIIMIMAALCLVPFSFFMHGAASKEGK